MKLHKPLIILPLLLGAGFLPCAQAIVTLAPVVAAYANSQTSATPLTALYDGDSLVKTDPDNVSTWTHGATTSPWTKTWQLDGATVNQANFGTAGWVILDLGSSQTDLAAMYLWNVTENSSSTITRGTQTFNVWYSNAPTLPGSTIGNVDYNFGGAWTQLGSTFTMGQATASGLHGVDGTVDLSGISSARYIGLELLTNYGSGIPGGPDGTVNRIGLGEVVFTRTVPEASSALLALAGAAVCASRRRRI